MLLILKIRCLYSTRTSARFFHLHIEHSLILVSLSDMCDACSALNFVCTIQMLFQKLLSQAISNFYNKSNMHVQTQTHAYARKLCKHSLRVGKLGICVVLFVRLLRSTLTINHYSIHLLMYTKFVESIRNDSSSTRINFAHMQSHCHERYPNKVLKIKMQKTRNADRLNAEKR